MPDLVRYVSRSRETAQPAVEALESRELLAVLTIITHGAVPSPRTDIPAWTFDMAGAIDSRIGLGLSPNEIQATSLVKITRTGTQDTALPLSPYMIIDWTDYASDITVGIQSKVGAEIAKLVKQHLLLLAADGSIPEIHFIGHSRGAYVNLEAIEELGIVPALIQMTTLDAQDAEFVSDGLFSVPSNVHWADNYYQKSSNIFSELFRGDRFEGPGKDRFFELDLTQQVQAWESGRDVTFLGQDVSDHEEVHDWYHWTIDTDDTKAYDYKDSVLNVQKHKFMMQASGSDTSTNIRNLLYGEYIDLDRDGEPDARLNGTKLGFYYSLGETLGPRSFAGFGGLDLVFVIDTTGSMSDDIRSVKNAASRIVDTIEDAVEKSRIAIVLYRDKGDIYSTRTLLSFTPIQDKKSIIDAINSISVGGGGDTPEAVFAALNHAIDNSDGMGAWRGGPIRKAIILMGDAPPHEPDRVTAQNLSSTTTRAIDADPVDIFTVGIGTNARMRRDFEVLALLNGGQFFNPRNAASVVDAVLLAIAGITAPPLPPTNVDLLATSDTGPSDSDDITRDDTPTFRVQAAPGLNLQFFVDGVASATATEISSGLYEATLSADALHIGTNAVTAVAGNAAGTSAASTPLLVQFYAPPVVTSVVVNDGAAQRSMVTKITVTIRDVVSVDAGAFELRASGGSQVSLTANVTQGVGQTIAVLTFTGSGITGNSRADGRYVLTVRGDLVRDSRGQNLDGNGDGTPGGNYTDAAIHRLFGDADGDADVDNLDFLRFRGTLGKRAGDAAFIPYFDSDGDGNVDSDDLNQFLPRRGKRLN